MSQHASDKRPHYQHRCTWQGIKSSNKTYQAILNSFRNFSVRLHVILLGDSLANCIWHWLAICYSAYVICHKSLQTRLAELLKWKKAIAHTDVLLSLCSVHNWKLIDVRQTRRWRHWRHTDICQVVFQLYFNRTHKVPVASLQHQQHVMMHLIGTIIEVNVMRFYYCHMHTSFNLF